MVLGLAGSSGRTVCQLHRNFGMSSCNFASWNADRSPQIRSVYRTIELSQGFGGHLSTVEAFFYGLDTLPLFLAIVIYIPFWPGRFIPSAPKPIDEEISPIESEEKA